MKHFSYTLLAACLVFMSLGARSDNGDNNSKRERRPYKKVNGPVQAVTAPAVGAADALLGRPWLFGNDEGY